MIIQQQLAKRLQHFSLLHLGLFCLLASHSSFAIDTVELYIEGISFDTLLSQSPEIKPDNKNLPLKSPSNKTPNLFELLHLNQLEVSLDISTSPMSLQVDLSKLDLPPPFKKMSALNITCNNFSSNNNKVICEEGQLSFKGLVDQALTKAFFIFEYDVLSNDFSVAIRDANLGSGNGSASFKVVSGQWQSAFNINNLNYDFIRPYVNYFVLQDSNISSDELEALGGQLTLTGGLSGALINHASNNKNNPIMTVDSFDMTGNVKKVQYQFGDDLAEQLALKFDLNGHYIANKKSLKTGVPKNYQVSLSVDALAGEMIQNDLYIVLKGHEKLHLNFDYFNERSINLTRFDISAGNIFSLKSRGRYLLNGSDNMIQQLSAANVQLKVTEMAQLTHAYLDDILSGTDYEGIQVEGGILANFKKNSKNIELRTNFNDFSLAFNDLSLIGLTGDVFWDNKERIKDSKPLASISTLSWQEFSLDRLPLGPSSFKFVLHNDYMNLIEESDLPIFDGALHLNSLEITNLFPGLSKFIMINSQKSLSEHKMTQAVDSPTLTVDGTIKPVSMALVSEHFGWPELDGSLSAVIPETTYNEKHLIVGGALMLQLFDGVIIVKDLVINEPLDDYAQLFANIDLNNLNLQSLTRTFNFGEIQGRVEGKLQELELVAWEPVAFDAYIRTPEKDNSNHRISQRAIDNLSSLGGASGLLSRSFLSFFETFRYAKIGLSCKLKSGTCQMSGVEDKGDSYYIVKGGGIPRIDVMGFQNQVNWKVLTSRLKAIQQANEVVIE